MTESKCVGIDLGTTNSCVALIEGGDPKVLTNSSGGRTTPSVVGFTDKGERLVGQSAKNQQTTNPKNTIFSIKRFMGRRHNEVSTEEKTVPYKVIGGANDPVKVEIRGEAYTPPEISATILQDLKKTAEDYLGCPVTKAVITVPAYFNDAQRKSTQEAGQIAGFEVERVIPEPTAAALAYGVEQKKEGKIAVFDLGGGTFDISILDIDGGLYETLSINGDTHLGGDDYDEILVKYIAETFRKKEGIDLLDDVMAHQRLKEACEKAKMELSTTKETTINLPFITASDTGAKHLQETLTRSKFEQLAEGLIDRLRGPVMKALQDAKLKASDIDECLLVGGSTRIPAVQALCKDIFGKEPNKTINPDEAVAAGAAIQAGILSADMDTEMVVLDVTPLSLSVETLGSVSTVMIPRNTTIPTSKTQTYSTAADGQTEVTVHVLQGERPMAADNRSLGRFNLADIPSAPRGMPQIDVIFDIDTNGILNVTAKDKATNKEQSIRIEGSSGLNKDEINKMTREAEEHAEEDEKRKELVNLRNQSDAAVHAAEKSIKEHGDKLDASIISDTENATNALKESLKSDDADAIKKSLEELSTKMQEIGKVMYAEAAKQAAADQNTQESPNAVEDIMNAAGMGDDVANVVKDADYEVKDAE